METTGFSATFQPVCESDAQCKCCRGPSRLYGVVDFNKNGQTRRGKPVLGCAGIPIYYYRCPDCGFIFTTAFDRFSPADFSRWIYNQEYVLVDPDYVSSRPQAGADFLDGLLSPDRPRRLLDYGSGTGAMAEMLRQRGFPQVECYDPYVGGHSERPSLRYDCLVSIEVVEHSVNPAFTFSDMAGLLDDPGLIIFSTLLQPNDIEQIGLNWWYAAPRNGHVSLHTRKSLSVLLSRLGLQFLSRDDNVHVAFRNLPSFARRFCPTA